MEKDLYQFTIGDIKCIAIRDGGHRGSVDSLFVNAPTDELNLTLRVHNLERDKLWSTWTCLLVNTDDGKLLIDAGVGNGNPNGGHLLPQLESYGIRPDDIDMVFITHGHPDHLGGCVGQDGKPVFAHARYVIAKREYQFWTDMQHQDDLYIQMTQIARRKLSAIENQLELVEGDIELLPGIRTIEAPGHTPGHSGIQIHSQGETLLNLADSVLHPLHLEHPGWYSRVDVLPEQMIATRTRLLELATRENALVLLFHFKFPSLGYVKQDGNRWGWHSI